MRTAHTRRGSRSGMGWLKRRRLERSGGRRAAPRSGVAAEDGGARARNRTLDTVERVFESAQPARAKGKPVVRCLTK
jgi:hypothetical protein